jgi:hypothetical protein
MNLTVPAMGLAGLLCLIWAGMYLMGLGRRWGMLVPFGMMLIASAMSLPMDWAGKILPTAWLPLQQRRSLIFLIAGLSALVMAIVHLRNLRGKPIAMMLVTLVVMGFYASLLRLQHEGMGPGFESFVYSFATLVPLLLVVPMSVDSPSDVVRLLRTVVLVNVLWIGMCALQFVSNSSYLTLGNQFRFVGMTSNPQHAGMLLSFFGVTTLWMLFNDQGAKLRTIYIMVLGVNLLMLVWTGSRTGIGMFAIGSAGVLYTRLGRAVLFMPVALVLAYVGFKVLVSVTGFDIGVDRIVSSQNTRDYAWWKLYTTGMENPLFGVGLEDAEKSENSWLYAFAAFGLGMLFLAMLATLFGGLQCLRAIKVRSSLAMDDRRILDLAVGAIAMYFAGAVLEGYMISRVSPALCFIMIYSNVASFMIRYARSGTPEFDELGYEQAVYDGADPDGSALPAPA